MQADEYNAKLIYDLTIYDVRLKFVLYNNHSTISRVISIVHRKGATPAQKGQAGLIPGSMATAGYLVCGKGVEESLCSASHGAGRAMSRQKAKESFTQSALKKMLSQADVTLIGGSIEEMPLAYKDIDRVMYTQETLVEVQGRFMPRIVRMNKE